MLLQIQSKKLNSDYFTVINLHIYAHLAEYVDMYIKMQLQL